MAIFQRILFHDDSYVNYFSTANSFTFECPYKLYGTKHSYASQCKELKFVVPKITTDAYFICTSDSLGVLFVNKPVKIYITLPVYEQILLRIEQMPRYLYYEEEEIDDEIYTLESANIEMFKQNCIFVNHNQVIDFYRVNIQCVTSGSFIGWSNWIIKDLDNNRKYGIVKSINYTERFSNVSETLKCDYVVLFGNQNDKKSNEKNVIDLNQFTRKIIDSVGRKETIIIPVEMTNVFLELVVHVLAIFQRYNLNGQIAVCSQIYNKLSTIINVQSEWLNNRFAATVCKGKEPFALNEHPNFSAYDSIYDLQSAPCILFMDELEYKLIAVDKMFAKQTVIAVNDAISHDFVLNIQLQAKFEEILEKNPYTLFITNTPGERSIELKYGEYMCLEENNIDRDISISKCNKIEVVKKGNRLQFCIEGTVHNKDDYIHIQTSQSKIKELFYTKRYMFIDGKYFFPTENKAISIHDGKFILEEPVTK